MKWTLAMTVLMALASAACATVAKVPADARLVEGQRAFDEGQRLMSAGQYTQAEPLLQRALEIAEAAPGNNQSSIAAALGTLAQLYKAQGQYTRAEALHVRALALQEVALGKDHPDVATVLNNLALLYQAQGRYAQAEPLYVRARAIWKAAYGTDHPYVATVLNNLALLYQAQGQYARAEPLYVQALTIWEAVLGRDHPDVAAALNNLASLSMDQGQYERAEPLYGRALAIRRAMLGKDHPDVAISLNNLALLYSAQGRYTRAEPLYEQALTIREAVLGKDHPEVAGSLNDLAILYKAQGQYTRAEHFYQRALAVREAVLGKSHPEVANSLSNLAALYETQGQYARAEPLNERALVIREAALGRNHPDVAVSLNNLAVLSYKQGQYARAEPLYERALAIWQEVLGRCTPQVAYALRGLASLAYHQGDISRAEALYEQALEIHEAVSGRNHPDVAATLDNLARLHFAQRNLEAALPFFERAFTASEQHLRQEVFGFSEARLSSVLGLLRAEEERLYALAREHPEDSRVRRLALSAALLRKGRSVEESAGTSRIVYRSLGPADQEAFERLRALRTQLSNLSLAGPGRLTPTDYPQRLQELTAQADALEADLARRSEPLRALHALPPPSELLERVSSALPQGGVLVEFVASYRSLLIPKPGTPEAQLPGELRYLALLLFADGHTRALDLGPAAPIDEAILRLHETLAARGAAYQPVAAGLSALVFRPLVPHLGQVKRLFLSLDGPLSLVPFAALHDGRGFLVEDWDITYLSSGKDLLRNRVDTPPAHSVIVLADPDFGTPASARSGWDVPALAERAEALEQVFSRLREARDGPARRPLPGTRREAKAIQRLLPQAQLFLGHEATKEALLKVKRPGVLHIATHGFFLEDAATPQASRGVFYPDFPEAGPVQLPPDPLLRSGLVLAGAGASGVRSEDSLVTALELAGLNLWGTQLVVLSACDTGRGAVNLGQGVYGLRRALVVAGAETVVTSLWKVSDETTAELMEGYYRRLLAGQGRTTALREAMKELRQKKPHPYFWAPFIAMGLDAPLRGLGPRAE